MTKQLQTVPLEAVWCPLCSTRHVTHVRGQIEFLEAGSCAQRRAPAVVAVRGVLRGEWGR